MVMGGDSRSEGRGFESRHRILDGHKKQFVLLKATITMEIEKDARNGI